MFFGVGAMDGYVIAKSWFLGGRGEMSERGALQLRSLVTDFCLDHDIPNTSQGSSVSEMSLGSNNELFSWGKAAETWSRQLTGIYS
jgi:hypothetical protein